MNAEVFLDSADNCSILLKGICMWPTYSCSKNDDYLAMVAAGGGGVEREGAYTAYRRMKMGH